MEFLSQRCSSCHLPKSKLKRCGLLIGLLVLNLIAICLVSYLIAYVWVRGIRRNNVAQSTKTWNSSDYQSNSEYYQNLKEVSNFHQIDNLRLDRLRSPRFHPINGESVMYIRKQYHMPDLKGSTTTLHWIDLKTNQTIQLTRPIWGIHDQQFFWLDAKTVLFLSNRGSSRSSQLFQLNLPEDISTVKNYLEPIQITDYPLHMGDLLINRQATRLAFSCEVYPNSTMRETSYYQSIKQEEKNPVYKFDKLFVRHWDEYRLGLRRHPFLVSIQRNSSGIFELQSKPQDILFGIDSDAPTKPFGSARAQWSFSASGNSFAYTRQYDETSAVAWSTNLDIYTVDLTAKTYVSVCVTCDNFAADADPRYSPVDEHVLVYRSQSVPGYESDQHKVKLINGSNPPMVLLKDWDRSINSITWSKDGQSLFLELGEHARHVVYKLTNITSPTSMPIRLLTSGSSNDIQIHPINDNIFLYAHRSITKPLNLYLYTSPLSIRSITDHNTNLLSKVRLTTAVDLFSFIGARNETIYGWHVPPINGTNNKTPLVFYIHGGPQISSYDTWGHNWNFQSYSAQGYAVIAINFHGSDSYGQNFTDSITGEYGTLPYEDLKLGLTAALKRFSYLDSDRVVAIGGSYGGYMINWIAGHPEMSRRFRTFISQAGVFDLRHLAYTTDELWFAEHDSGGFTPFDNLDKYERDNPIKHVLNWTQPMLIIHGARDFRIPDTQSIGAFVALQRREVPSRLLYFPSEGHAVVNPFNSLFLHKEVFSWIKKWTT
ncbi:unnamed protein product [Adineta ricciae]|uniref:Peptidase S9 prolyl oligopeptidase catalytic domain-containing protein n=1 Tax=Adineta ricciae TaxID=249248 RepID=A0A815R7D1_ADIRI|nr:unnamed protein product [Adineta ricciae]CAF1473160.1 unnamed protein product [Adineta ricciae]